MSVFILSHLAFLYRGIFRGVCLCLTGLMSISAYTASWSEMPGMMSVLRIFDGMLVISRSNVFVFLVGSSMTCTIPLSSRISASL